MPGVTSTKTANLLVSTQAFVNFSDSKIENNTTHVGTIVGENQNSDDKTRYRVLGLSEGIHNGLRVLRDDIKQMAYDVSTSNETIPVVLDHSFAWNDVVGKVTGVTYYDTFTASNGKQLAGALIMDIELLSPSETTPKLNETLYRLKELPELAKFSVAFKFTPTTDENGNVTVHDLVLKHLAIVTNPADPSTQILEKLSRKENCEYMSFDMEEIINRGNIMPTKKQTPQRSARYARRSARFNNPATDVIARNALLPGTYPIQDVQSVTMRPGQRSPLACGCGDELYDYQDAYHQAYDDDVAIERAEFAKSRKARAARLARIRKAAKFSSKRSAEPSARFGARKSARFTQYGVPTVFGNPWDYPVADTYPNVNQLISLRKKRAALGKRAKLLEEREAEKFSDRRAARFDDELEQRAVEAYDEPTLDEAYDEPTLDEPTLDEAVTPVDTAAVGNVSDFVSDDVIPTQDPVVEAYIEAGLIDETEIPVVEAALKQHRAQMARKAAFARKARKAAFARKAQQARFAKKSSASFEKRAPAQRSSKFEGLINEYMVPSANLPRDMNVNIRREEQKAELARRQRARFAARKNAPRSGSFFADGGTTSILSNKDQVPVQNTSISPVSAASSSPATFVGNDSTKNLLEELKDTKKALAQAESLSVLRAQALSLKFADKDLIMSLNEDQLKKYIDSQGMQNAAFSAQMNPFVGQVANKQALGQYITEFADSFTKGNLKTVCTLDQVTPSAEAAATKIFGGN